ncbi:MAG: glycosyltransferase family 39 protein, partial [Candidatus Staskawiczbacteria bacterium]|nr:glycosyltransferase family 39 protein [Candidatus Staskawiczbacteria bacterium]
MFIKKNWKKYIIFLLVIVISIYALSLRLDKLSHHKLWNDELNQLDIMKGDFWYLIQELPHHELNTYLNGDHFLIYPFFKIFSLNKWGLAIPHIISTILGFYLLYLIGQRYFKTIWGYIISFSIVCFNASLINHATEIRSYAVLPTLALASLYLSEMLINEINLSSIKKFFIGTFFLFTVCFHTYGFFILFSCLIYVLLNKPCTR